MILDRPMAEPSSPPLPSAGIFKNSSSSSTSGNSGGVGLAGGNGDWNGSSSNNSKNYNGSSSGGNAGSGSSGAPSVRRRLTFADLSTDIKVLILSFIHRPSDMVSLCLVCKQLHELTVRQLYHSITLDVGCDADTRLAAFLNPRNIGLRHVRNVDLYRADPAGKCNQMRQADLAIRMILEFMPENTLEKFSWHPWSPFSTENLLLLYKKQKKMKWLEAIGLDRQICDCVKTAMNLGSVIRNVSKLGLYPDSRDTLSFANLLLSKSDRIEKLTLHANFDDMEPLIPVSELNDRSTEPGLVTRTIFSHMLPFETCTPMFISELTLQKLHLRYAGDTYCKVIDFRKVKSLRVFCCSGAETLFSELSRSTRLPERLETLEFKHEDDNRDCEALNALDGFLCLVSGIERLTIDISCTRSLPSSSGITRHSRTLKSLNVHACSGDSADVDEEEHVFDYDSFEKICGECTRIEQLSVAFPKTHISRASTDEFAAFSRCLASLAELVTLNITTWPTNSPTANRLPRKIYDHLLNGMAQLGFEASIAESKQKQRSPKLNVIAFGTSEKIYEREDGKHITIFLKGTQTDPLGKTSPLAVQLGWCLRKYAEPRSDVLDFALMRSVRPPTREPPPSDDSEL